MRISVPFLLNRPMRMAVVIATTMRVSVRMGMPMVMMTAHGEEAEQVHTKADGRHQQKLVSLHLRWIYESLDGLEDDKDRDQDQEDAVGEARQRLYAAVAMLYVRNNASIYTRGSLTRM
jgi:hypothetical protein